MASASGGGGGGEKNASTKLRGGAHTQKIQRVYTDSYFGLKFSNPSWEFSRSFSTGIKFTTQLLLLKIYTHFSGYLSRCVTDLLKLNYIFASNLLIKYDML